MVCIRIVFDNYMDDTGKKFIIGGVESYIHSLLEVSAHLGYNAVVYQYSTKGFECRIENAEVKGIPRCGGNIKRLIKAIERESDTENDILIFATDFLICKNSFKHSIAVQHGIAWDITKRHKVSDIENLICIFKGAIRSVTKYRRYKHCEHLVCVDYNFANWYRTQVAHVDNILHIIPNYARVPENIGKKPEGRLAIIFARRFVEYRGTKLFANVIERILKKYSHIEVTVAGEGPDEQWLKNKLGNYSNVRFIKFEAKDSIDVHLKHHIAVVPTTGSEGTSLSLLEAMAAGCAPVATNVGGMTNIIIDGYNGMLINPDEEELYSVLDKLITDDEYRRKIQAKAYETVRCAFSYNKWFAAWSDVLKNI